jgi:pimeloyl-ACP methyl ester carboxylesterase
MRCRKYANALGAALCGFGATTCERHSGAAFDDGGGGAPSPSFVDAPCRFDLSEYSEAGLTATCGDLIVREDRAAGGREIALHVARFPAATATGRPPLVILNGGPGESTQSLLGRLSPLAISLATASAEVIVFDQRGVGQSTPALPCALPFDRRSPVDAFNAARQAAVDACLETYVAEGVAVGAYETIANADDVEDLRAALGYAQFDLVGLSYGSRLALEIARRHPAAVRAMVLDGVAPAHVPHFLHYGTYFNDALGKLAQACAQDAGCAAAYGDVYGRFFEAVAGLDADPLPLPRFDAVLTGSWLVEDVYASLRQSNRHGDIPLLVDGAVRRDVGRVESFYAKYSSLLRADPEGAGADANGMNRAVTCSDRWQRVTPREADDALAGVPAAIAERIRRFDFDYNFASCARWPGAKRDDAFLEPVSSDRPTLLLAGDFDPRSPPSLAERTAEYLPNSFVRTVARGGHGVSIDPCALGWVLSFFADPSAAPSGECASRLTFSLPSKP